MENPIDPATLARERAIRERRLRRARAQAAELIDEIVATAARIRRAGDLHELATLRTDAIWSLLAAIERSSACLCISDVARVLRTSRQAAHELVHRAARRGVVQLLTNPHDRRIVQIQLTPRGRRTLDSARKEENIWQARLLLGMSDPQIRLVTQMLREIRHRLLAEERTPGS